MRLVFTGTLDPSAGDWIHYTLRINGQQLDVRDVTYDAVTNSVVLQLPPGTLHAGDTVSVDWLAVQDAEWRMVEDGTWQGTAP